MSKYLPGSEISVEDILPDPHTLDWGVLERYNGIIHRDRKATDRDPLCPMPYQEHELSAEEMSVIDDAVKADDFASVLEMDQLPSGQYDPELTLSTVFIVRYIQINSGYSNMLRAINDSLVRGEIQPRYALSLRRPKTDVTGRRLIPLSFAPNGINAAAAMVSLIGNVMPAQSACARCRRGTGPFAFCISSKGLLHGSCTNCHYNAHGSQCDLREMRDSNSPRVIVSDVEASAPEAATPEAAGQQPILPEALQHWFQRIRDRAYQGQNETPENDPQPVSARETSSAVFVLNDQVESARKRPRILSTSGDLSETLSAPAIPARPGRPAEVDVFDFANVQLRDEFDMRCKKMNAQLTGLAEDLESFRSDLATGPDQVNVGALNSSMRAANRLFQAAAEFQKMRDEANLGR